MKVRTLIFRKGLFTRLGKDDISAHNYEYVYLWRKVLDELLIGLVSNHTSAVNHSMRFFNAQDGDRDWYYDDHTGDKVTVDLRKEFEDVCSLADIQPDLATVVANRVYERAISEKE